MNSTDNAESVSSMLLGEVASSGLARGRALLCDCARKSTRAPRRTVSKEEARREFERFDSAVLSAEEKLQQVQAKVRETVGDAEAEIIVVQIMLLRDAQLHDAVRELCLEKRMNVEAAVERAIKQLVTFFISLEDGYFRERAHDLHDVGRRLLDELDADAGSPIPAITEDCVIVTGELLASVVAQLEGQRVRALVVEKGGLTAHATILARSLGIPMLVHVSKATRRIRNGDLLIVDALAGRVFVNPEPAMLGKCDRLEASLQIHKSALKDLIGLPAITSDGVEIKLCANIGQTVDAVAAATVKADGVGLYRTEFVFLVQDHFPSEDEQYRFYRTTAEHLQPRETVIRVLDVGSDKPLSYFPLPREANPTLGCRGMRLLLAHPAILQTQLRAILRLSASHPVAILLPMIDGLDDLRAAKAAIDTAQGELAASGQSFNPRIPVGAMIETPSAAVLIERLADEVDFFSVGSNDLVQFLLAADRISEDEHSTYEPLHPAVIQVLATLATSAGRKGKPISLCGEIASDPFYTKLLIGLGFRSLSVSPNRILDVKHAIRSTSVRDAEELAARILALSSTRDTRACMSEDWSRHGPVSSNELDSSSVADAAAPVTHNAALQRFELQADGAPLAFLSYVLTRDRVVLDHTFVPEALRGRGIAAALTQAALDDARQRGLTVIPHCSYVAGFVQRHPEFARVVGRREGNAE
jgi:phosphoenolpyruvate-protein phosphotransferase